MWRPIGRRTFFNSNMRTYFRSIAKPLVFFFMVTFVSMSMAMASYICPQLSPPGTMAMAMPDGVPCAEMDKAQPVLCAQSQAGEEVAVELPTALSLTVPGKGFIVPAPSLVVPLVISHIAFDELAAPEAPPYLHTRRLRI